MKITCCRQEYDFVIFARICQLQLWIWNHAKGWKLNVSFAKQFLDRNIGSQSCFIVLHLFAIFLFVFLSRLFFSIFFCRCFIDTNWRDDKPLQQQRQLRDQSREQQHQDEEYGDDSSSAIAAEQQRIQAQEMAAYHKRLASLPLPEAQKLTQIDLKHSDSHVTAQVGHPAYLKCAVSNQGDQLVSPDTIGLT